ncbi:hypothetical protein [Bradyrhizobium sediminis]|uniref:hypothetical protein n=1 Tax=Bradyrhizobium sediminis TaxID=2840469 RepID=UPI00201BCCC6|nr:hypothetical protein [Bradyrhizobium sediminis]
MNGSQEGRGRGRDGSSQISTKDAMRRNLMAVLKPAAPSLNHVALLQGNKAYGVHVRPLKVPAREGRS